MTSREEHFKKFEEDMKKKLVEFKAGFDDVYAFSQKIKVFENQIINQSLTGEENRADFGNYFKGIYINNGIYREFFKDNSNIANYDEELTYKYLFRVEICTINLYGLCDRFGLFESFENVNIFFVDTIESIFYIEDENIEDFLESLNKWYLRAKVLARRKESEDEIDRLQKKLERELKNLAALPDPISLKNKIESEFPKTK